MGVIRHVDAGYAARRRGRRRARRAHPDEDSSARSSVAMTFRGRGRLLARRRGVRASGASSRSGSRWPREAIEANLAALSPHAKRASAADDGAFVEDFCNWQRIEPMRRFIRRVAGRRDRRRADGRVGTCGCTTTTCSSRSREPRQRTPWHQDLPVLQRRRAAERLDVVPGRPGRPGVDAASSSPGRTSGRGTCRGRSSTARPSGSPTARSPSCRRSTAIPIGSG